MMYGKTATGKCIHVRAPDGRSYCGKELVMSIVSRAPTETLCGRCLSNQQILEADEKKRQEVERRARIMASMHRNEPSPSPAEEKVKLHTKGDSLLAPGHVTVRQGVYRGEKV